MGTTHRVAEFPTVETLTRILMVSFELRDPGGVGFA